MIKDRGNIKWTGLMLTEHREKLEEIFKHDGDIERPVLDEQQLERLDVIIKEAIRDQFNVKMLYYENWRLRVIEGKIKFRGDFFYLDDKKLLKDNIIDIVLI